MSYDPEHARRARLDRADALKRGHEAAAYDKWFRSQVQAALDDPRPSIPHAQVSARWAEKRAQLLNLEKRSAADDRLWTPKIIADAMIRAHLPKR